MVYHGKMHGFMRQVTFQLIDFPSVASCNFLDYFFYVCFCWFSSKLVFGGCSTKLGNFSRQLFKIVRSISTKNLSNQHCIVVLRKLLKHDGIKKQR